MVELKCMNSSHLGQSGETSRCELNSPKTWLQVRSWVSSTHILRSHPTDHSLLLYIFKPKVVAAKILPQRFMNLKWLLQRLSKQMPQRFINLNDTLNFNIWGTYTSPTLSINRAVVDSIALQTKYVFSKSHDISQDLRICIVVHGSCGWHQCALYHYTTKL